MTLIVYKNRVLAADSRETEGGAVVTDDSKKIYSLVDCFSVFHLAATGTSEDCAWFYEWLESNFKKPSPPTWDGDSEALLVQVNVLGTKIYRCFMNGSKEELDASQPHVIGSEPTAGLILAKEFNMSPKSIIETISKYNAEVNGVVQEVQCKFDDNR